MERHDTPDPPNHRPDVPAKPRHISSSELEAVIRRAVELQAGHPVRPEEGVSEDEVVRIGQELGLDPATVRRAMIEVRNRPHEGRGLLTWMVGSRTVQSSRVLHRPAGGILSALDRYLRETELMVPQRRFQERTRYLRDTSIAAALSRVTNSLLRSPGLLDLPNLDATVSALDEGSCVVELSADLGGTRGGLVAGVLGSSGGVAVGWVAAVLATPIADPLALVGVPLVAGAWFGMRAIYSGISRSTEDKLESLLDRLEHNDLG